MSDPTPETSAPEAANSEKIRYANFGRPAFDSPELVAEKAP